jgi:crossover junction endodeoxyribonuclease RuvC
VSVCVGIDPGATGAIAFLDLDTSALLFVDDMPCDRVQVGAHLRSRVARRALLDVLLRARGAHAFTERAEARPMRRTNKATGKTELATPGAAGMMSYGENYGCVLMGCTAAEMSLTEVRPGMWKKVLGVGASKDDSRRRAAELYPKDADKFARVKDDGRAEAVLLALYGIRTLNGGRTRDAAE